MDRFDADEAEYRNVMLMILFILILAAEVFLSHQDGHKSGDESRKIASVLRLPNHFIRVGAHILFFALLMFTGLLALPGYKRIVIIAVLLWTILDEATKPMLHNFRHFSLQDVGWNLLGAAIGSGLWYLIGISDMIIE